MTIPVPDVRELAARALWACKNGRRLRPSESPGGSICWTEADAVLAAVEPVIRRQVAEEIARHLEDDCDDEAAGVARGHAVEAYEVRVARSHSTQPTEEETTDVHL